MVEGKELESLLDNALEDFDKDPEPTVDENVAVEKENVTIEKGGNQAKNVKTKLPDFNSFLETTDTDEEAYIDELTKEFDKTFASFLESTPELQTTLDKLSENNADLPNFDDNLQNNIAQTMENLFKDSASTMPAPGMDTNPEAMMPMLEGLLNKLLSKEVLHEPLQELCDMYPGWLEEHQEHPNLHTYTQQFHIVSNICSIFNGDKYQEENAKIYQLLCDMQDTGPPPQDIVTKMSQEIPGQLIPPQPGASGSGLSPGEQCSIQ